MAVVIVDFSCGCGYRTRRLEEAEGHSNRTKHKMTVSGTVTPFAEVTADSTSVSTGQTIAGIRAKLNGG